MNFAIRVKHVDEVPQLIEKLGVLATVEVVRGSLSGIVSGIYEETSTGSCWHLTSVAHTDQPIPNTFAAAFKRVSGKADLKAGMELMPRGNPSDIVVGSQ